MGLVNTTKVVLRITRIIPVMGICEIRLVSAKSVLVLGNNKVEGR
jgi:hypothetical protein